MDYDKLFEQFYYEYQSTDNFTNAMYQERDSDKYALISIDFVKWLIANSHLKT